MGFVAQDFPQPVLGQSGRRKSSFEAKCRLGPYAELGIDDFIMNVNIGVPQSECLVVIERFASEVMPHFSTAISTRRHGLPAARRASST
jgi:hypothetical protein